MLYSIKHLFTIPGYCIKNCAIVATQQPGVPPVAKKGCLKRRRSWAPRRRLLLLIGHWRRPRGRPASSQPPSIWFREWGLQRWNREECSVHSLQTIQALESQSQDYCAYAVTRWESRREGGPWASASGSRRERQWVARRAAWRHARWTQKGVSRRTADENRWCGRRSVGALAQE